MGGLLGVVYAISRIRDFEGLRRLAAVGLVGAAVALSLVGAFPLGTPVHVPAAVAVFVLAPLVMLLDAVGALRASERTFGVVSIALVGLYAASWALFYLGVRPGPGLAIPEAIGAAIVGLWVILSAAWSRGEPDLPPAVDPD